MEEIEKLGNRLETKLINPEREMKFVTRPNTLKSGDDSQDVLSYTCYTLFCGISTYI